MNAQQVYEQLGERIAELREREQRKGTFKTLRQMCEEQGVKPIDVEELKAIVARLNSDDDDDDSPKGTTERSNDVL